MKQLRALPVTALALGALLAVLPAAASFGQEQPITFRRTRSDHRVERDGRAVQHVELQIQANNDEAARGIAQQVVGYSVGIEHLELVEAHTIKADGRRLPVRPDAVREQLAPGTTSMPMYADRKQMVVVFPDMAAGDAVHLAYRRVVDQPLFPGYWSAAHTYARTQEWQDSEVSVTLPAGMDLAVEAPGMQAGRSETGAGGQRTWRWRLEAKASPGDNPALAPLDRAPRFLASTMPDWLTFGRAWGAEAGRAAAVTPEIKALADEVTAGTDDRREQARRLYEWVSLRVRWVALYLGQGGILPHTAADALAARYGDCKDQVVLLTALLHAKGIQAEPALISTAANYGLPTPPALAVFNHVVTYLPEWDIYADTTAGGAPFGSMPSYAYGKPVVHAGPERVAIRRVPPLQPGAAVSRLRTEARLDADGRITGTTRMEGTGPYATLLRASARASQGRGAQAFAAQQLRSLGQNGSGSVAPEPLHHVGPAYKIEASFRLDPQPGLAEGDPFLMPSGPAALPAVGEGLLAPVGGRYPAFEPTPCYAGTQEEELSLALPPNLRPVRLPRSRRIEEPDFTYESRWSQDGNTVRIVRRLESRLTQTVCALPQRAALNRALETIRRDRNARLILEEVETGKPE